MFKNGKLVSFDVIVTRHNGLVDYLRDKGLVDNNTSVVTHVDEVSQIQGKDVCGILPHYLSSECHSFSELTLNLTPELRGQELTKEQVSSIAGELVTYKVLSYEKYEDELFCEYHHGLNGG